MKKPLLRYSVQGLLVTFSPLLAIVLFIGGYYIYENLSGAKRWQEVASSLNSAGVITDPVGFKIEMPTEEKNFAATPLIASCYQTTMDANGSIVYDYPKRHDRFAALKIYKFPNEKHPVRNWVAKSPSNFGQLIDLIEEKTDLKADVNGTDAARFLSLFAPYENDLRELVEAAKRPYVQMPFTFPTGNPHNIATPFFDDYRSHSLFQKARGVALLDENRSAEAVESLRVLYQIGNNGG